MVEASSKDYIRKLIKPSSYPFHEIEQYAMDHHVPIMEKEGIAFLKQLIRLKKPQRILEIGSAIGYSALQMGSVDRSIKVVTVERDVDRFDIAKKYLSAHDTYNQIDLLCGDAFDLVLEINARGPYDVVFIDAAKGQYQRFFTEFTKNIAEDAVIITDNVLFRGYVFDQHDATKRLGKLADKINDYNIWLSQLPDFETVVVPIGDGVAITTKLT